MRLRELLAILKEVEEKTPGILEHKIELVVDWDAGSTYIEPALTMGADQRLYFITEVDKADPNDAS